MNELQWAAAKKAAIAVMAAICVLLIFKVSPILAILIVFLSAVGFGSYNIFLDAARHKENMERLEKERKEMLDRIKR